jgi:hypothetical protein
MMKTRFFKLITVLFIASSLLVGTAFAFPLDVAAKTSTQIAVGATLYREVGGLPRAEASSWKLGKCTSSTPNDWIVTFKFTDSKKQWAGATASRVKFYASAASLVRWYPGLDIAYVKRASASGVTLCISSGNGIIKASDVSKMWVWLTP